MSIHPHVICVPEALSIFVSYLLLYFVTTFVNCPAGSLFGSCTNSDRRSAEKQKILNSPRR